MYCRNCGKRLGDHTKFCTECGTRVNSTPTASLEPAPAKPIVIQPQVVNSHPCPKCKGLNVQFQTVSESKKAGCMTVLLYIFLAITILGLFILIPICLRKKSKTVTYGVCQHCGHRWKV